MPRELSKEHLTAIKERTTKPVLQFCPYCGHRNVYDRNHVPRCADCRAIFFLDFSRYMRAKAKRR